MLPRYQKLPPDERRYLWLLFNGRDEIAGLDLQNTGEVNEGRNVDVLEPLLDLPDVGLRSLQTSGDFPLRKSKLLSAPSQQSAEGRMFWPCRCSHRSSHALG